jgi:hypothetical protein
MNWDALGAIGEIVGAAGVIVSLLYLASQVRSNSRQLRHAGDVWTRGLSGLDALRDDEELVRFSSMLLQAFWAYEEVLHYHQTGDIEEWAWTHAKAPVENFMRTPGFQEWWRLRKDWFSEDFQEFVDASMPETTGALVEDFRLAAK